MKLRYLTVTTWFALIAIGPAGIIVAAEQNKSRAVQPAPKDKFEIRNIEGWIVYINKQDLAEHRRQMDAAIDHLHNQLYQVRLVVPAPAVAIMQQRVPIWMEYDSGPGLSFHPSYKWLLDRGYASPDGLTSLVSNCRSRDFCRGTLHQPWVVLHELAHGYDYLYLGQGKHYGNARLQSAYEHARKSGAYESVLCRYSTGTRHYAMSNKMEYFAENSEAYFGTNDFYPFVRPELKEHDPCGYALLEDLWGVDAKRQRRLVRSLVKFIRSQAERPGRCKNTGSFVPTADYDKRHIEGWTVYVCPELVREKAYGDHLCRLLRYKLHLVKRYMPDKALEKLQEVPIWLERHSETVPYMTYHASAEAIKARNENPDKLHAVEIGNAARFRRWQNLQQFAILNQLARAYYDRLADADREQIRRARDRAVEGGRYDSVLRFDGKRVPHPALKGPVEFFAEMTESYYGVNDYFPFLQFELRQYDPDTCRLLAKIWTGKAK